MANKYIKIKTYKETLLCELCALGPFFSKPNTFTHCPCLYQISAFWLSYFPRKVLRKFFINDKYINVKT